MSVEDTAKRQRILTIDLITKHRLNLPAVWFRPAADNPSAADALADRLEVDLQAWDGPEHNLGVRLEAGHFELGIKAADDAFVHAFFFAANHLKVDARFAFGVHQISSILLRIEAHELIESWQARWPRGYKDKRGHWTETTIKTSSLATKAAKAVWRYSHPLPGSVLPEGGVVWRPNGKAAALDTDLGVEDLEPRPLAATSMESVCRAIAYATLAYWVRVYLDGLIDWDATLTRLLGGWIARAEVEGRAINAEGKSLQGICWSPLDTRESALDLVEFLRKLGASDDLRVAYLHGEAQLIRNPIAPVAGWGALEDLFTVQGKIGIRRAFRAGLDLDIIERLSERYVHDTSTGDYVDRESIPNGLVFDKKFDQLVHDYDNEGVFVGRKRLNPFRLYCASSLRTDVARTDMFPGEEPAALLRYSPVHGVIKTEDLVADEYKVLNTYRGFIIKPVGTIDPTLMAKIITALDIMLGLLTRDNTVQMDWLKQFIAWTIQYPDKKQQVCPVIVGGQGIGKSVFGETLMYAIFGDLAGSAAASLLSDNAFLITPFIGKLLTFIDEVRLESVGAINEIKKIVRQKRISGQIKFGHQRDYYIPSRLILAANQADIGLTSQDAADRALFFIMAWTAENKGMTDPEFQKWAWGYKDFYSKLTAMLEEPAVRQHLMRYFRDYECSKDALEDLTHSSRFDENVVRATMSKHREVAREIAASARIIAGNDITAWFNPHHLRGAITREDGNRSRVEAQAVMKEYELAGVIEAMSGGYYRFKWGYGKLLQELGKAHNLELLPIHPTGPGDYDANPIMSAANPPPWRGNPKGSDGRKRPFDVRDTEYIDDE